MLARVLGSCRQGVRLHVAHRCPRSRCHPLQSIREMTPNRQGARPGVMTTLNLFLEMPLTPDAQLPTLRPKVRDGGAASTGQAAGAAPGCCRG